MKKFVLVFIVFSMLGGMSLNAQRPHRTDRSALTVDSWDNRFFEITIDGRVYESRNGVFSATDMPYGNHRVIIARSLGRRGIMQEVYRGEIFVPRGTHVFARLNRHNRLVVTEKLPMSSRHTYRQRNSHTYYDNGPRYSQVNVPSVIDAMNRSSFESDKLIIAKQALHNNEIYAAGVERIIRQFSFESSRLEFAKYAYSHCIDPENYYRVNSAFAFSSSIEKLNDYIYSSGQHGGGH